MIKKEKATGHNELTVALTTALNCNHSIFLIYLKRAIGASGSHTNTSR